MPSLTSLPPKPERDRAIIERRGLYEFVRRAWSEVESSPFIGGFHLEEMCVHLEAVARNQIDRLIINVPPGMSKSLTTCVFFPSWTWTLPANPKVLGPASRFMFASFDASLSNRDSARAKELVRSPWYQERWGAESTHETKITVVHGGKKANTAGVWYNGDENGHPHGGLRFSTSVGAKATGWHAHIQVCDDPIKPRDIADGGDLARGACERAWDWWGTTMATRKADPNWFARIIIMQRLHHEDLAGKCIEQGGYTLLKLPMRFVSNLRCVTYKKDGQFLGGDRRSTPGELLCPERFSLEAVTTTEKDLGSERAIAAQLQQEPTAESGDVFHRDWFLKRWQVIPHGAKWLLSVDCAFKDAVDSDYVVIQCWAYEHAAAYLVDQSRGKWGLPATVDAVKLMAAKWPNARLKLIEDKANGPAVEQSLRSELAGILMVDPTGSKFARAESSAVYWRAGNIYLPDIRVNEYAKPWLEDYIQEHLRFPMGSNDDQVDSSSQAILYINDSNLIRIKKALEGKKGFGKLAKLAKRG